MKILKMYIRPVSDLMFGKRHSKDYTGLYAISFASPKICRAVANWMDENNINYILEELNKTGIGDWQIKTGTFVLNEEDLIIFKLQWAGIA
jgi:hypothetical protein